MIQSLATRTDLSWRIYEETDIRTTISSAASRGGYRHEPIADEPFSIPARVKALHKHWTELGQASVVPERWEDESDTTFLKPLLQAHSIEHDDQIVMDGAHPLILTPEQASEADRVYRKWRKRYDWEASYLQDHPPRPIAWHPVAKSQVGLENAWDSVLDGDVLEAGQSVSTSKLAENKAWKPIYGSFHNVPSDHVTPGLENEVRDYKEELVVLRASIAKQEARRKLQDKYLKELRAESVDKTRVKEDL